jgi:replication-associated recombination protein RarA
MLAPERREVMSRSIILELSNLSEGDIAALIEHAEASKSDVNTI